MTKILLTLLFKLSLICKSIVTELVIFFDDIIIFLDDVGVYLLNVLRSIRFDEVREYLTENLLTINHTGLGNNLFDISNHLGYCWKKNFKYSFPDINLLYDKIPEYPKNTIYRNLPIKHPQKNMTIIRKEDKSTRFSRMPYYINFHKYRKRLLSIFSIDSISLKFINEKYFNNNRIKVSMHVRRGDFVVITKIWNFNIEEDLENLKI